MGIFSSDTKVSTSTSLRDLRAGVEGGGTAISNPNAGRDGTLNISVGSDDVALASIAGSNDALLIASDFLNSTFTNFLNTTNQAQERADNNIRANQELAAELLTGEQESSDDRLIKVVFSVLAAGVVVAVVASGQLKGIFK